jgi:hypothetical protein
LQQVSVNLLQNQNLCHNLRGTKNTLRKNGQSQLSPQRGKKVTNQYPNNNQHTEYNHFFKTFHFLQCCLENIFGIMHLYFKYNEEAHDFNLQQNQSLRIPVLPQLGPLHQQVFLL